MPMHEQNACAQAGGARGRCGTSVSPSMHATAAVMRQVMNRPEPSVEDTARPRSSWPPPAVTAASCVNRSGAPPANDSTVTPAMAAGRRSRSLMNCASATAGSRAADAWRLSSFDKPYSTSSSALRHK